MKFKKNDLLKKAGFVYFRGKWIPRLPGKIALKVMVSRLVLCNNMELHRMLAEFRAALYGYDIDTDK
jgi:hypothetical protein